MHIELKKIDKDTLKVGDVVGVMRPVRTGWYSQFRHMRVVPAKIVRITTKRTKIETDQFGVHDKNEHFYEYDGNAKKENKLAFKFETFKDGAYKLVEFNRSFGLEIISDEDLPEVAEHMKAITEILQKYKEK